jgi:hypothetical protein
MFLAVAVKVLTAIGAEAAIAAAVPFSVAFVFYIGMALLKRGLRDH